MRTVLVMFIVSLIFAAGCTAPGKAGEAALRNKALEIGAEAPDFWLKNQDQQRVSLSDFRGRKNVIIVFFPLAFTPV